jgi:hypothetical protein
VVCWVIGETAEHEGGIWTYDISLLEVAVELWGLMSWEFLMGSGVYMSEMMDGELSCFIRRVRS